MSVSRVLTKMRVDVGPNMTPMVDIVMCILIFFMLEMSLTAPELFLKSNTAAVDKQGLGQGPGATKLPDVRMNIKLARVMVNGTPTTMVTAFNQDPVAIDAQLAGHAQTRIEEVLQEHKVSDNVQVLIVPDREVPWQDVVTIYDDCLKLQYKQVAFAPVQ